VFEFACISKSNICFWPVTFHPLVVIWSKETGVSYLLCSLTKNTGEKDPPRRIFTGDSKRVLFLQGCNCVFIGSVLGDHIRVCIYRHFLCRNLRTCKDGETKYTLIWTCRISFHRRDSQQSLGCEVITLGCQQPRKKVRQFTCREVGTSQTHTTNQWDLRWNEGKSRLVRI